MEQEQKTISGQIRAARGLLDMSQAKLAEAVGVSSMTIKRAEGTGKPFPAKRAIGQIREALEALGVEFLESGEVTGGPGVAMKVEGDT